MKHTSYKYEPTGEIVEDKWFRCPICGILRQLKNFDGNLHKLELKLQRYGGYEKDEYGNVKKDVGDRKKMKKKVGYMKYSELDDTKLLNELEGKIKELCRSYLERG